jgi:hypothetical protein
MSDRDAARELLRELLHEALANGNGAPPAAPQVPAPPVAAVLRPSTWQAPPAPGEVIGDGTAASPPNDGSAPAAEFVRLDTDADLDRFVHSVLDRAAAIRAGQLRFTLARGSAPGSTGVMRVERGAVTERTVKAAADAGARLLLARGAVMTPLAREKARALGIEIERERR